MEITLGHIYRWHATTEGYDIIFVTVTSMSLFEVHAAYRQTVFAQQ